MTESDMKQRLDAALAALREQAPFVPRIALILGSGMTRFADEELADRVEIAAPLPGMPRPSAPNHNGGFLFGRWHGVPVAVLRGRLHYYEGHAIDEVVMPIRLLGRFGVEILVSTNAVGGIDPDFRVGDLMLVADHIASFMPSPLRGPNDESIGVRYPDMTRAYDPKLGMLLTAAARDAGIELKRGVLIQLPGPQFETPAEVRMCRILGADAVGMSTAVETIAARHAGMRVAAVSWVSNLAAGISPEPLSLEEVVRESEAAAPRIKALLAAFFRRFSESR